MVVVVCLSIATSNSNFLQICEHGLASVGSNLSEQSEMADRTRSWQGLPDRTPRLRTPVYKQQTMYDKTQM